MEVKHGTFSSGTGTGSLPVTGVGFQPTAYLLFSLRVPNENISSNLFQSIGMATAAADQSASSATSQTNQTTTNTWSYYSTQDCYLTQGAADGSPRNRYQHVSMDADGFTINRVANLDTTILSYLAIGGVSAKVVDWSGGTLATQDVTGAGFQPSLAITISPVTSNANAPSAGAKYSIGVANSSAQWVAGTTTAAGESTSETQNFIRNDAHAIQLNFNNTNYSLVGVFDSFLPDGMRINWTTTGANRRFATLFVDAPTSIGTQTAPATSSVQNLSFGAPPLGALLVGNSNPNLLTVGRDWMLSVGASDPTSESANFSSDDDAVGTSDVFRQLDLDALFKTLDSSTRVEKESAAATFNSSGIALDWIVDGTQGRYGYLVFTGDKPDFPTGPGNVARRRRVAGARR